MLCSIYIPKKVKNICIFNKLVSWFRNLNTDLTLKNCLFGSIKLTKNVDADEYKYSGYGVGFDSRSEFLFTDECFGKNFIIFGTDMNSFVHIDNKGKSKSEGPTQELDDTALTAEAVYPITFTEPNKKFVLGLICNERNRFLFVSTSKIYQFSAKKSEIKNFVLCLGNISKDFTIDDMKKNDQNEL